MGALSNLTKSLSHQSVKASQAYLHKSILYFSSLQTNKNATDSQFHRYQSRRTLILDSASSELVKLNRFSDSDSGNLQFYYCSSVMFVP